MDANKVIRDPLMTAKEAAEYLALAEQTVRDLAHKGQLPKVKLGRSLRFRLSDLNEWVEDRRKSAPAA